MTDRRTARRRLPSPYELVDLHVRVLDVMVRLADAYARGAMLPSEYAELRRQLLELSSELMARIRKAFRAEEEELEELISEEEAPEGLPPIE